MARVCKAWATAAAAATVHVQHVITERTASTFQSWLAAHAGRLVSLQVSRKCMAPGEVVHQQLQLPCEQLSARQSLSLTAVRVQTQVSCGILSLGPHPSSTTPVTGKAGQTAMLQPARGNSMTTSDILKPAALLLPKLKELKLICCYLDSPNALTQLVSQAPGLTKLVCGNLLWPELEGCKPWQYKIRDPSTRQQYDAVMRSVLQLLPQLAFLQLSDSDYCAEDAVYQQVQLPCKQLSALQSLSLTGVEVQTPGFLQHLELSTTPKQHHTPVTSRVGQTAELQSSSITSSDILKPAGPLLPRLRDLELIDCHLDSPEALTQLVSQAPGLTKLVFGNLVWPELEGFNLHRWPWQHCSWDASKPQLYDAVMCSVLWLLPRLADVQLLMSFVVGRYSLSATASHAQPAEPATHTAAVPISHRIWLRRGHAQQHHKTGCV